MSQEEMQTTTAAKEQDRFLPTANINKVSTCSIPRAFPFADRQQGVAPEEPTPTSLFQLIQTRSSNAANAETQISLISHLDLAGNSTWNFEEPRQDLHF